MLKHLSSLKCCSSFLKKLTANLKSGFSQKPKNHFSTNDYNQLQDLLSTKLPSVNVSQLNRKQVQSAAMEFGQVITSPNDARKYKSIQLPNGLRALLISDRLPERSSDSKDDDGSGADERLSAAALSIGVGCFSDPPEIPGLAHFLEHMVFMGSEKYPDENDFDSYIKQHGGGSNAFTDCEKTVFYFDISKDHFYDGLDRFAQFFIKPLMKPDSVDREIKAVDSEFDMSRTSDRTRKEQLLGTLARDGHPMGKFMCGNAKTLKKIPAEQGIDVYSRLQEFHKRAYSAHYMTLAVQSLVDLDTLQTWVTEIFSPVPNNGLTQPTFKDQTDPFHPDKFCRLYKAIPVQNTHQVDLTWSLPSLLQEYRKKPLNYLGFLIGHEGKGSALSYLKKKHWALSLYAGNSGEDFEHNSTWAMFGITVTLTPLGMEHLQEVVAVIFQYLDMLRKEGPQKRVYDEIKTIEDNLFRWQDQCDPCEYVENLCGNMHSYPPEHYITGDSLFYEYDPELIARVTEQLTPRKASLLFYSKKMGEGGGCTLREKWYQVKYQVEDIPKDWLDGWENLDPLPDLHLPAENTYIATDFTLKEPDIEESQYPQLITNTDQSRLWYKKDTLFKVPKAYIQFILKSPVIGATALSFAMFDLFLHLLKENLCEIAYAADYAQLSYSIAGNSQGFVIKLDGFNHKLPKLFETIVEHIVDFKADEALFARMKDQLQRVYHNKAIDPSSVAMELRLTLLQHPSWNVVARHACLERIRLEDLLTFVHQMKSQLFVDGYIHGNFTAQEARNLEKHLLKELGCAGCQKVQVPEIRVLELPIGDSCIRVENFNTNDNNSMIVHYFQHGPGNLRDAAINELLNMRMEEPCFDILRTRLQLGYDVGCVNHITEGIIGFSINVCSQADKFTMAQLGEHMDNFLKEFKGMLDNITQEEFDSLVQSLITLKKCQDAHMGEEATRNWAEILLGTALFDRLPKQIAVLEQLKMEDLQQWLQLQVPDDKQYRRLTVQVLGNAEATKGSAETEEGSGESSGEEEEGGDSGSEGESEEEEEAMEEDGEANADLEDFERTRQFHILPPDDANGAIMDIQAFCDKRPMYPVSKVL